MINLLSVMSPATWMGMVEAITFSAQALAAGETVRRHMGHSTDGAVFWKREASMSAGTNSGVIRVTPDTRIPSV